MHTRPPYWPHEAFELGDGYRRLAVSRGAGPALEPGYASSLLREQLRREWFLRGRLAEWYRRNGITVGLGDDERMLAALLRDVESGWLRVCELDQPPAPVYTHNYSDLEPRRPSKSDPWSPDSSPDPAPLNDFDPALDEPTKVEERTVEYLAVGDFNFSTGHAVMLPGPSVEGEREGDHADGIALIAGLLAHLRDAGERRVMVAGHTDAVGSFADNIQLSERRAQSVKLACEGDAEGFADHASAHGEVADAQEVLRWIALRFGWSCDPGSVDGKNGAKTSVARSHFRERLQAELGMSAGSGPTFQRADWLGFFRLYEQDLAARMGVTIGGLPALRARLSWTEPAVLGCGEHWPQSGVKRSSANRADRRVELLCFAPEHVPSGAGAPPGASVYGDPTYRWISIRPGPGPHPLGGPCFELSLPAEDLEWVGKGSALRLRGGPYDLRHQISDARLNDGFLTFHFHGISVGYRYDLTLEHGDGSPPDLMFEAASLDSHIEGIGVTEHRPEPVIVHVPRGPEQWEETAEPKEENP